MKPDTGKRSLMHMLLPVLALAAMIALVMAAKWFASPSNLHSIAIRETNKAINGAARFSSIEYLFPAGVHVKGLELIARGDSMPAISVDQAWGRISIIPLLFHKVFLPMVHAEGVHVAYFPDRKPMLANLFALPPTRSQQHPWPVCIGRLVLDDASFQFADTSFSGINVSVNDISASGSLTEASNLRCNIKASHGTVTIAQRTCDIDTVMVHAVISGFSTVIDSCLIGIAGGMRIRGSAVLPYAPGSLFAVDARISAENISCPIASMKRYGISAGAVDISAHLSGHYSHPTIDASLRASGAGFRRCTLRTAIARARLSDRGIVRYSLSVDDPRLNGDARGEIVLGRRAGTDAPAAYSFHASFASSAAFQILRECGISMPDLPATVRVRCDAGGTSFNRLPDSMESVISLREVQFKGKMMPAALCTLQFVNGHMSTHIDGDRSFSLSGSGDISATAGHFDAIVSVRDAAAISAPFLDPQLMGNANGSIAFTYDTRGIQGTARFSSGDISWGRIESDSLLLDIAFTRTSAEIRSSYAHLRAPVSAVLAYFQPGNASGLVDATISAHGPLPLPSVEASVRLSQASFAGIAVDTAFVLATYADSALSLGINTLRRKNAIVTGSARWSLANASGVAALEVISGDSAGTAQGTVNAAVALGARAFDSLGIHAHGLPVAAIHAFADSFPECEGSLDADLQASGPFANPAASAFVRVREPGYGGWSAAGASARAVLADSSIASQCTLLVGAASSPVFIDADVALCPAHGWGSRGSAPPRIHAWARGLSLNELSGKVNRDMTLTGALDFDLSFLEHNGAWSPRGSLDIARASIAYAPFDIAVDSATVHVHTPGPDDAAGDSVQAIFTIATGSVRRAGQRLDHSEIAGRVSYSTLIIDTGTLGYTTGRMAVAGALPLRPSPSLMLDPRFRIHVRADSFPLPFINGSITDLGILSGTISGSGTIIGGKAILPSIDGGFLVCDAMVDVYDIQPALGPLQMTITVHNDTVTFAPIDSRWGAGRIQAQGWLALSDPTYSSYAFTAHGHTVPIVLSDDDRFQLDSLRMEVTGGRPSPLIWGRVILGTSSLYRRVSIVGMNAHPLLLPDTGGFNPDLDLRVGIPDSLTAEVDIGQGFATTVSRINALIGGAMLVSGTLRRPSYSGEIAVANGKATFLGKEFIITRGYARLPGGSEINPSIMISARTALRTPGSTTPGDTTGVILNISGELQKPVIRLSSEPPGLTQAELMSLLTIGITSPFAGQGSGQLGNQASDILSQSLSAFATQEGQKLLGLEELSVQGNVLRSDRMDSTVITASKKVGDRIMVTYSGGVGALSNHRARISWQILPFLFLDGESDMRGNVSALLNVRFKR